MEWLCERRHFRPWTEPPIIYQIPDCGANTSSALGLVATHGPNLTDVCHHRHGLWDMHPVYVHCGKGMY